MADLQPMLNALRETYDSGLTRSMDHRRQSLRALAYMLQDHRQALAHAFMQDLGWTAEEMYLLELDRCLDEIITLERGLSSWSKSHSVSGGLAYPVSAPHTIREPYGVVLICAIAAGNAVAVKLSEFTPTINPLLAHLLATTLNPAAVQIIQGNSNIGKQVYKQCAENLIPCALELGGSCPAIVDGSFDLDLAAKRIVWAKFTNAGQTCVAVNHVLILRQHQPAFVKALDKWIRIMIPNAESGQKIINQRHCDRLLNLISNTQGIVSKPASWTTDAASRRLTPTIVSDLSPEDPLVEAGEIFGPICPVIPIDSMDEAIALIKKQGSPLAIYIFSEHEPTKKKTVSAVRSGAVVFNDALMQMGLNSLPFGGVGSSGFGKYHGKHSFDLFTYERSFMKSPGFWEMFLQLRYPPATARKYAILRLLLNKRITFPRPGQRQWISKSSIVMMLAIAAAAWGLKRS